MIKNNEMLINCNSQSRMITSQSQTRISSYNEGIPSSSYSRARGGGVLLNY